MKYLENIGTVIGRPVLSVQTANKLGRVNDLVVDPLTGKLAGVLAQLLDESYALVDGREIRNIGPDAVMIEHDASLLPVQQSPVKSLPLAKSELKGVKVITEGGQLIGTIANLYIHLADKPVFVYEVRSSIFDKLLGHAFYLPASLACAFSEDRTSLIVSDDTESMAHNLEVVGKRLLESSEFQPHERGVPQVTVRSYS